MSLSIMLANVTIDKNFAIRKHKAAALTRMLASKNASTILVSESVLVPILVRYDRFVVRVGQNVHL